MLLEQRMEQLKERFGLEAGGLNLDLGPLGNCSDAAQTPRGLRLSLRYGSGL
jgi:hypothetical protein